MDKKYRDKLTNDVMRAMRKAVKNVIKDHRQKGLPLYIWRNGKVVKVNASKININKLKPAHRRKKR